MKKGIKNIILMCSVVFTIVSCTKNEIETFSGEDVIYFKWSIEGQNPDFYQPSSRIDSTSISFAYELPSVVDTIYSIPVKIMGEPVPVNRSFNVELMSSSTAIEGVDFDNPTGLFIPANEVEAMIPLKVLRNAKMKNEELSIKFRLIANEHFRADYHGTTENSTTTLPLEYNTFELTISDMLVKPKYWSPFMDYYLGDFSAKKLILYATVNNIPIPNWNPSPPDLGTFFGRKNVLKAYLQEQTAKGTPVLEDDGSVMKLGPYAKRNN